MSEKKVSMQKERGKFQVPGFTFHVGVGRGLGEGGDVRKWQDAGEKRFDE